MRERLTARWLTPALLAGLAATACAPERAPTAVAPSGGVRFDGQPYTGSDDDLEALTRYLFVEDESEALADVAVLIRADRGSAAACSTTSRILTRTFSDYFAYALYGQYTETGYDLTFPRPVVQKYIRRLAANCGRVAPANGIPDAALDVDGGVGIITAADGGNVETFSGPLGQAGVRVPAGTFDQDVLLTIVPRAATPPLPTTLPQSAPYYEVTITPAQPTPYRFKLDVGLVIRWPDRPPSDHLVLGHQVAAGQIEVLQPIFLTTPSSGVGRFGGPAYLKPPGSVGTFAAPATSSSLATRGAVSPFAVVKGTTTTVSGAAESLSPFGLVAIYQPGVNPNAFVSFSNGNCYGGTSGGAVVPYEVRSNNDIVVNYQELAAGGGLIGTRKTLYLRGLSAGGARFGNVQLASVRTRQVRFYYGATLFATRTAPSCSD